MSSGTVGGGGGGGSSRPRNRSKVASTSMDGTATSQTRNPSFVTTTSSSSSTTKMPTTSSSPTTVENERLGYSQQQSQSKSFVPPVAQRKIRKRKQQERVAQLQNRAIQLLVILLVTYGILYRFPSHNNRNGSSSLLRGGATSSIPRSNPWISMDTQPFLANEARETHHLILVAGHSVTISGHLEDAGADEADWFLLDYQKGKGLPQAIQAHISAGIEHAHQDPDSLLIFSGGETRALTGPLSEGSSYFHVADAMSMWKGTVRARTTTEEFATDSFENLMFSICRFREVTGHYPTKITTVSFTFKQKRFENLHALALRWPQDRFQYVGLDPPVSTGFDLDASTRGEMENSVLPFEQDPYGCSSPILQQKRKDRNPFSRTPPYPLSCPEMKDLLSYCGPELFPVGTLPWDTTD